MKKEVIDHGTALDSAQKLFDSIGEHLIKDSKTYYQCLVYCITLAEMSLERNNVKVKGGEVK